MLDKEIFYNTLEQATALSLIDMNALLTQPLVIGLLLLTVISICLLLWQLRQNSQTKALLHSFLPDEAKQKLGKQRSVKKLLIGLRKQLITTVDQAKQIKLDTETQNKVIAYHNRKLQAVMQVYPDGLVTLDESGVATFANEKLANLIGLSSDKIIGNMPHDWCKNQKVMSLLVRYEGNVTRLRRAETVEYSPDDKPDKTIQVSASPIALPTNPDLTVGILILFRDVTAEAMARRSRDDFVAHVSHELKSPLNIIKMHSELLLDVGDDAEQRIMGINVINDEVERVSTMVTDLLNITRLEVGNVSINRKRIRFRDFLADIFENMKRAGEKDGIKFNLNLPGSIPPLSIDKDLMRIAFNNILSNAIKYNDKGGLVTMEVEEVDNNVQIRISDTGIGISAEDQKKIFQKFYRSEDDEVTSRNGHGLGLSLAHEIIVLHNGRLTVESERGKGTTFTIEIAKTSTLLKEAG